VDRRGPGGTVSGPRGGTDGRGPGSDRHRLDGAGRDDAGTLALVVALAVAIAELAYDERDRIEARVEAFEQTVGSELP
jgi:hypothetical protein